MQDQSSNPSQKKQPDSAEPGSAPHGQAAAPQGQAGIERRAQLRVPTNIAIEIAYRETGAFVKSYMLNVSNGGVFIKTPKPLDIDTPIQLKLQLPGDTELMRVEGRVVWTNTKSKYFPAGMGIQFTKIDEEHQKKIGDLVKKYEAEIKKWAIL